MNSRNGYMLSGKRSRRGYDWWWHSLVGVNARTGEKQPFFIEYYVINPALGGDKVTIKIPRPLYDKIAGAIDGAGYDSVTDFVVHVLRDIVSTHAQNADKDTPYSDEELEQVKDRLRSLGYL